MSPNCHFRYLLLHLVSVGSDFSSLDVGSLPATSLTRIPPLVPLQWFVLLQDSCSLTITCTPSVPAIAVICKEPFWKLEWENRAQQLLLWVCRALCCVHAAPAPPPHARRSSQAFAWRIVGLCPFVVTSMVVGRSRLFGAIPSPWETCV